MQLLQKCANFTKNVEELKNIYILFIRSVLEQSCTVWHSSLTQDDSTNLERVQKSALKIILQEDYEEYNTSLQKVNIQSLYERRISLCENFATNTASHEKLHTFFPQNHENLFSKTRHPEKYQVNMALTERYKSSSIPYMQRLLNQLDKEKHMEAT